MTSRSLNSWGLWSIWWDFYWWMVSTRRPRSPPLTRQRRPCAIGTINSHQPYTHCHRTYLQNSVFSQRCVGARKKTLSRNQTQRRQQHFVRQTSSGSNIVNMSLCICLVFNQLDISPLPPPETTTVYRLPNLWFPQNCNTLYFQFISKT